MSAVSELLRSLTKNEQSAQVAHQKWANERIARFFNKSLIRSFFRKKHAIRSENQWANFQPWNNLLDRKFKVQKSHDTLSYIR